MARNRETRTFRTGFSFHYFVRVRSCPRTTFSTDTVRFFYKLHVKYTVGREVHGPCTKYEQSFDKIVFTKSYDMWSVYFSLRTVFFPGQKWFQMVQKPLSWNLALGEILYWRYMLTAIFCMRCEGTSGSIRI